MKSLLFLMFFTLSSHAFAQGGGVAGNGGDNFYKRVLVMVQIDDHRCQNLRRDVQEKVETACRTLDNLVMISGQYPQSIMSDDQYQFYNVCCQQTEL